MSGFVSGLAVRVRFVFGFVSGVCGSGLDSCPGKCPGSSPVRVWFVSGFVCGSRPVHVRVRLRVRLWFVSGSCPGSCPGTVRVWLVFGFGSGSCLVRDSCLVRVWVRIWFISGSYLFRVRFGSRFVFYLYLVRIYFVLSGI